MFNTEGLTPMQLGRLNKALDKPMRFDGVVMTLRQKLLALPVVTKGTSDGMIRYNRRHFNRLDYRGQAEYIAKLKAQRIYYLNDWEVPKVVYDAV